MFTDASLLGWGWRFGTSAGTPHSVESDRIFYPFITGLTRVVHTVNKWQQTLIAREA